VVTDTVAILVNKAGTLTTFTDVVANPIAILVNKTGPVATFTRVVADTVAILVNKTRALSLPGTCQITDPIAILVNETGAKLSTANHSSSAVPWAKAVRRSLGQSHRHQTDNGY
jgi:hypothetical protein